MFFFEDARLKGATIWFNQKSIADEKKQFGPDSMQ